MTSGPGGCVRCCAIAPLSLYSFPLWAHLLATLCRDIYIHLEEPKSVAYHNTSLDTIVLPAYSINAYSFS